MLYLFVHAGAWARIPIDRDQGILVQQVLAHATIELESLNRQDELGTFGLHRFESVIDDLGEEAPLLLGLRGDGSLCRTKDSVGLTSA